MKGCAKFLRQLDHIFRRLVNHTRACLSVVQCRVREFCCSHGNLGNLNRGNRGFVIRRRQSADRCALLFRTIADLMNVGGQRGNFLRQRLGACANDTNQLRNGIQQLIKPVSQYAHFVLRTGFDALTQIRVTGTDLLNPVADRGEAIKDPFRYPKTHGNHVKHGHQRQDIKHQHSRCGGLQRFFPQLRCHLVRRLSRHVVYLTQRLKIAVKRVKTRHRRLPEKRFRIIGPGAVKRRKTAQALAYLRVFIHRYKEFLHSVKRLLVVLRKCRF